MSVDTVLLDTYDKPVCKTPEDLAKWAEHYVDYTAHITRTDVRGILAKVARRSEGFVLSTSFSGIGAPEHSLNTILALLGKRLSESQTGRADEFGQTPQHSIGYAIDWDLECRRELCALPADKRPLHIFDNICNCWNVEDYQADFGGWTVSNFNDFIRNDNSVKLNHWCCLHESDQCCMSAADCHIGGTPCPDWSTQGAREAEYGQDLSATMAFMACRWKIEEPIWCIENVPGFDWQLMCEVLTSKYWICQKYNNIRN